MPASVWAIDSRVAALCVQRYLEIPLLVSPKAQLAPIVRKSCANAVHTGWAPDPDPHCDRFRTRAFVLAPSPVTCAASIVQKYSWKLLPGFEPELRNTVRSSGMPSAPAAPVPLLSASTHMPRTMLPSALSV